MLQHSVFFNWLYTICYKVFLILVPLVTTPYISRVLGAEALGIYSYCVSISCFFIVLGQIGIPLYGKRLIAINRDNKSKSSDIFWQLFTILLFQLSLSLIAYFIGTIIIGKYWLVFVVCSIGHISNMFDISWLYEGNEDFSSVVKKNVLIKICSILGLFLFVKSPSDIYIYTAFVVGSNFLGNIPLWIGVRKYVDFCKPTFLNWGQHATTAFILFIPFAIIQLCEIIDKSMLGFLCSDISEVAFYEQSRKIIGLCVAFMTSLGVVLMPRIALTFDRGDIAQVKNYIQQALDITMFIGIPVACLCAVLSRLVVPWFFGPDFIVVSKLLVISAPLVVFMSINDLLGSQVLTSLKQEKILFRINIIGVLINIILNIILIIQYKAAGALFATLLSESVKTILLYNQLKGYISFRNHINSVAKYLSCSAVFCIVIILLQRIYQLNPSPLSCMIYGSLAIIFYIGMISLVRDKWIIWCYKKILRK